MTTRLLAKKKAKTIRRAAVREGRSDAPPCWVVDPLDGTVNYVHRLQSFAVSIGLYHQGKMRLGVILDPGNE